MEEVLQVLLGRDFGWGWKGGLISDRMNQTTLIRLLLRRNNDVHVGDYAYGLGKSHCHMHSF